MALGPKAMGEAIIANLKRKSGKDLAEWQAVLADEGITDRAAAEARLLEHGLGRIQAMTVAEVTLGTNHYEEPDDLVDQLFAKFPDQRALFDHAVEAARNTALTLQPCRGYAPFYADGRIAVSFKPTSREGSSSETILNSVLVTGMPIAPILRGASCGVVEAVQLVSVMP